MWWARSTATVTTVLPARQIIGANVVLNNLASMTSTKADNLRVTTKLPTTADNTFQGLTNNVGFTFVATQRAATDR